MIPLLKISKSLVNKLSRIKEPVFGKLYGVFLETSTILLSVQVESTTDNELEFTLPTEVDLYGLLSIDKKEFSPSEVKEKLQEQVDVTDNPIFLFCCLGKTEEITAYVLVNDQLQSRPFVIISEQEIYEDLVHVRLRGNFSISSNIEKSSYEGAILDFRNSVTAGNLAFNFSKTPIYLLGTEYEIGGSLSETSGEPIVGDIYEHSSEKKKKVDSSMFQLRILDVVVFKKLTHDNTSSSDKEHAPICIVTKKHKNTVFIPVKIDVLSLISKQTNLCRLYDILVESVIRNLKAFQLTLTRYLKDDDMPILPEVHHFFPDDCGHFLSIWLPKNINQKTYESSRAALHEQFLLSKNKPLFRKGNEYLFKASIPDGAPLINPHEALKNTNNEGKIAVVKGRYSYFHYNQNRMNDNGWGCAYRSLQTLASWFKWQGYTDKEVPTFDEIQKCLVDIGDKPSSFIGSRQWIGSMEVHFVLNTLLGVTCRIINVSNGAEMIYQGPELLRHFEDYGSPVMIGGGNLAHTILGVDYNQTTGNIKFLILDPHYTGSEDLQVILSKGWCSWKGIEFWNKTSYYNMCLPLVPLGI